MVIENLHEDGLIIELTPNRSVTWQQTKWIIALMIAFVMIIAIAWSFVGAWIVLPFAGLEVGLFAYLMYRVSKFTYSKQVLFIDEAKVTIEYRHAKQQVRQVFDKAGLHVAYSESEMDWELPRIALKSDFHEIEIGTFLNLDDRKKLASMLENAGFMVLKNKWWKN
ncbi:MAG: DUF2244 domain-containing protein [Pseudomonadota bacterium]